MTWLQWRAWLARNGHTVSFGDWADTPLVLATENQIMTYVRSEHLDQEVGAVA